MILQSSTAGAGLGGRPSGGELPLPPGGAACTVVLHCTAVQVEYEVDEQGLPSREDCAKINWINCNE